MVLRQRELRQVSRPELRAFGVHKVRRSGRERAAWFGSFELLGAFRRLGLMDDYRHLARSMREMGY